MSSTMVEMAWGKTSPVCLWRLLRVPRPRGLVSESGVPARPWSLRRSRSTSPIPVTAMPYLGSGSSTLCPPATGHPADVATSRPPRRTSVASSMGRRSVGQHSRLMASTGVPPMAYTSDRALAAAIRPQSYGSSTTGVKKSAVLMTACPPARRTTAASSPSSRPTISSGEGCPTSPATIRSRSPGAILQAQPPPCAVVVSLMSLPVRSRKVSTPNYGVRPVALG